VRAPRLQFYSSKSKTKPLPNPKAGPSGIVKGQVKGNDAPTTSTARNNRRGEGDPLKAVCTFEDVYKSVGGRVLLDQISGSIHSGAKIGILGINGAGKSTFLKILAKQDDEYDGKVIHDSSVCLGYLPQEPNLPEDLTVEEHIRNVLEPAFRLWDEYQKVSDIHRNLVREKVDQGKIEKAKQELEQKRQELNEKNWINLDQKIQKGMVALRCPPSNAQIKNLSGGERRRVALCCLLLQHPDFLLLDEPTNHLDAESVAYLERFLREYKGTVLAVTHDRFFLENSAGWILEVADGKIYPHKGNYTSWLEAKQVRIELQEKKDKNFQKFLSRELEWIRKPAKARQAKSQARVKAYEQV